MPDGITKRIPCNASLRTHGYGIAPSQQLDEDLARDPHSSPHSGRNYRNAYLWIRTNSCTELLEKQYRRTISSPATGPLERRKRTHCRGLRAKSPLEDAPALPKAGEDLRVLMLECIAHELGQSRHLPRGGFAAGSRRRGPRLQSGTPTSDALVHYLAWLEFPPADSL